MDPSSKPPSLRPTRETTLLAFLKEALPDWKTRTLKLRLLKHCVAVNGAVVTHPGFALKADDEVEIRDLADAPIQAPGGIKILFQDDAFVGIIKPAGLLSVGTNRIKEHHALAMVREAIGPNQQLWPVHRLDRETSGVLLLARDHGACKALQARWDEVQKVYFAVVEGHPSPPDGLINQPLLEDKSLTVRVRNHPDAKDARTRYWTRDTGPHRSLLELHLETGRRHQIRAHLAWLGTPVVGDTRLGDKAPRMALHAHELSFTHPLTQERITLRASNPSGFSALLKGQPPVTTQEDEKKGPPDKARPPKPARGAPKPARSAPKPARSAPKRRK